MHTSVHVPHRHLRYHHHHPPMNVCSPCEIVDPLSIPVANSFAPSYYHNCSCRRNACCIDQSCCDCISRPAVIQTNVHNDVCYHVDDACDEYDDDYGHTYRLSRSKVQLVDLVPKPRPRRNHNRWVLSTFQAPEREVVERIIVPRSTVVRNTRSCSYEKPKPMRLVPLYRSIEPQCRILQRHPSVVREVVPIATLEKSCPRRQTIKVRTLSPL